VEALGLHPPYGVGLLSAGAWRQPPFASRSYATARVNVNSHSQRVFAASVRSKY